MTFGSPRLGFRVFAGCSFCRSPGPRFERVERLGTGCTPVCFAGILKPPGIFPGRRIRPEGSGRAGFNDRQHALMITYRIGQGGRYLWEKIVLTFSALGIDPNVLTAVGFAINLLAAYLFAYGYFRWAGLTV